MSHRGENFQHGKQRCTQNPKTEQPVEQRYASLVGKFLHKFILERLCLWFSNGKGKKEQKGKN